MAGRESSAKSSATHVTSSTMGGLVRERTPPHHSWAPYRGSVLFTGPDGLGNNRVKVANGWEYQGEKLLRSHEQTSSLSYLHRAPPQASFPRAGKHGRPGEIGWEVETFKIVKGL